MALTISQQVALKAGEVSPPECSLHDIVSGVALRHANYHFNTHKVIADNDLASAYQQKKYNVAQRVINGDGQTLNTLFNLIVSLAANVVEFADFGNFEQDDWESVVENNISRAFELAAGIQQPEVSAYNLV